MHLLIVELCGASDYQLFPFAVGSVFSGYTSPTNLLRQWVESTSLKSVKLVYNCGLRRNFVVRM
jgi:hypothetical protein